MKKHLTLLMVFVLLFSLTACNFETSTGGNNNYGNMDDEFRQVYENALENFVEEDYGTSLTYNEITTEPDQHKGKLVKFTGEILQYFPKGSVIGDGDVYDISVDRGPNYSIRVETAASGKGSINSTAVGDTVTVYGMLYKADHDSTLVYAVKIEKTTAESKKGIRSNPFKIGETATFKGLDYFYDYNIEITATDVIRGKKATDMFENNPDEGKEFFLVMFKIKAMETKNNDVKVWLDDAMFDIVNKDGIEYNDRVYATGIKEFNDIYSGGETEGYFAYIIDAGDEPSVVFFSGKEYSIWFSFAK